MEEDDWSDSGGTRDETPTFEGDYNDSKAETAAAVQSIIGSTPDGADTSLLEPGLTLTAVSNAAILPSPSVPEGTATRTTAKRRRVTHGDFISTGDTTDPSPPRLPAASSAPSTSTTIANNRIRTPTTQIDGPRYNISDHGPFTVYTDSSSNGNVGNPHPVAVGRRLHRTGGL